MSQPLLSPNVPLSELQASVYEWAAACFGLQVVHNKPERNFRFLEEALELVQSLGCSKEDALRLVDYVYERPAGDPPQEVGGVTTTLSALCAANDLDLARCASDELNLIWQKIDTIRAKQKAKTIRGYTGPLPGAADGVQPFEEPDTTPGDFK